MPTRIRIKHRLLPTKRAIMLLVILHDNQAPYAKDVIAAQFDGAPFYLHAHGTRVVVDLRDVGQDDGVDFCTDGFGEVFGELWVFDLAGESLFNA